LRSPSAILSQTQRAFLFAAGRIDERELEAGGRN
jgi:hypothetical protein